jgi:large repetitive protein
MSYDTLLIQVTDSRSLSLQALFTIPVLDVVPLVVTPAILPGVNQFASNYSQALSTTGGTAPYSYVLTAQSSINPNTWQLSSAGVITAQVPMLQNVETATLTIQVTDALLNTVTVTRTITTARQVPAGAAALGYNALLWATQPTPSNIFYGAYGSVPNLPWSSGWPFSSTIPPASLYSLTTFPDGGGGALAMLQLGSGTAPSATTPIISSVQLSSSNVPIAATLPLIPAGIGFYFYARLQSSGADPNIRPSIFAFPTQHNQANTQDIDPNDGNNHRWLEIDDWQGEGANGKQAIGWNGNLAWSGLYSAQNQTLGNEDITLEHDQGIGWAPATGTAYRWLDNVAAGSMVASSASGVALTSEQLAWINAMTYYLLVAAFNDGSTAYTLGVYEVGVYVPFLDTSPDPIPAATVGVAYSFQMTTNNGTPYTPYVWTDPDGILATYGLSISAAGLISGTPTQSGTLIAFNPICTDTQGNIAQ